jgi:DNA-binding transcriptional MerR regulator
MARLTERPGREYLSIGDVCALLDLKPHVLRYWETQFQELAPPKNRSGKRVYRAAEVELIALIRRLVHEEKFTIEGARRRLTELRTDERAGADAARALERAYLRTVRLELESILRLLEPGRS